jgi:RNA polymerase sigma-70 factor, ECF subfamily
MILRGAPEGEVRGGEAVAKFFAGRAKAAQPADIDGTPGLVWAPGGKPRVVFSFTTEGDRIVAIDLIGGDERLAKLDIAIRS